MGEMEAFFDDGRRFVEIETPAVGYHAAMARRYRQAGRLPVTPSSAESQIQHHRSGCSVVGSKPMKVQATVRAVKRDSYFRRCATGLSPRRPTHSLLILASSFGVSARSRARLSARLSTSRHSFVGCRMPKITILIVM